DKGILLVAVAIAYRTRRGLLQGALHRPARAADVTQDPLLGAHGLVAAQHRFEHPIGSQPQQGEQGNGNQQLKQGKTAGRPRLPTHRATPMKPSRLVTARSCSCPSLRRCSASATQTVMRSSPGSALAW